MARPAFASRRVRVVAAAVSPSVAEAVALLFLVAVVSLVAVSRVVVSRVAVAFLEPAEQPPCQPRMPLRSPSVRSLPTASPRL
jgi:hypothetical protein